MRFSECHVLVPLIESKDYGSAGIDSDSVHMGKVHSFTAVFEFGAITGDSVLKAYSGATAGTKTTALALRYRLGSADYKAALADQFGAFTSLPAAGLTLTAATYDHRQLVVELNSDEMTDGQEFLTFEISNVATVLNVGATGIGQARYPGNAIPTVLA